MTTESRKLGLGLKPTDIRQAVGLGEDQLGNLLRGEAHLSATQMYALLAAVKLEAQVKFGVHTPKETENPPS